MRIINVKVEAVKLVLTTFHSLINLVVMIVFHTKLIRRRGKENKE